MSNYAVTVCKYQTTMKKEWKLNMMATLATTLHVYKIDITSFFAKFHLNFLFDLITDDRKDSYNEARS